MFNCLPGAMLDMGHTRSGRQSLFFRTAFFTVCGGSAWVATPTATWEARADPIVGLVNSSWRRWLRRNPIYHGIRLREWRASAWAGDVDRPLDQFDSHLSPLRTGPTCGIAESLDQANSTRRACPPRSASRTPTAGIWCTGTFGQLEERQGAQHDPDLLYAAVQQLK
jgi:hypothetical protein